MKESLDGGNLLDGGDDADSNNAVRAERVLEMRIISEPLRVRIKFRPWPPKRRNAPSSSRQQTRTCSKLADSLEGRRKDLFNLISSSGVAVSTLRRRLAAALAR